MMGHCRTVVGARFVSASLPTAGAQEEGWSCTIPSRSGSCDKIVITAEGKGRDQKGRIGDRERKRQSGFTASFRGRSPILFGFWMTR